MMKKGLKFLFFSVLLALITGSILLFLQEERQEDTRPEIIMGTAPGFKPFEYTKEGQVVGFDVDLAKEIAKDNGYKLKIKEFNFEGLIPALKSNKIDFIAAGFTATEERRKNVDFSIPYYSASQMVLVKKNNNHIKYKKDLKGKKVGVELGTTGDEIAKKLDVNRIQFSAVPSVLQDLRSGRIDAAIMDNAPAKIYANINDDIKILPNQLSNESYAIAVNKDKKEILAKINSTISRIKEDGTYDELIKKNFSGELSQKMTLKSVLFGQGRYQYILKGLGITISLALISTIFGIVIGLVVALMRISKWKPFKMLANSNKKYLKKLSNFAPLKFISQIYITIIRGTPLLVQLLIMYYIIFGHQQDVSKLIVAAIAFGINSGAYVAEIIRGGIESLPKGQWEASKVLGLGYFQAIIYIIMPQAMRAVLPSLIGEFITLLKETSIVGWIGLMDLMRAADNIRFETATAFESLIMAALIYLLLTTIFTQLMGVVERKLKVDDRN